MSRLRAARVIDGALVVDKPAGPTSHDVVAAVRRALGGTRVGHTGTLDPLATGVLPLLVGRATRLARFLAGAHKQYEATVRFGWATDTYDAVGQPVAGPANPVAVDAAAVARAIEGFRGEILQQPPAHSAKKVAGVRAYTLARREAGPALAPVKVTVHELELMAVEGADVTLRVTCSAGFYVRSLAHDLGRALGVGAHLAALRRTASGAFGLADACPLDEILEQPEAALTRLVPMRDVLADWPAVGLTEDGLRRVRHGQPPGPDGVVPLDSGATGWVRLLAPDGSLVAVAECHEGPAILRPSVVLV